MRYTPGLSAALSRTFDFIIASWASLVGRFSSRGVPRIISVLASHAHGGAAAIDRMGRDELGSASSAGEAAPPIDVELLHEAAALPARIPIIAKAGAARLDRLLQHVDDGCAQQRRFLQRNRRRRARRIYPCPPKRFISVNVPDACDFSLLHYDFLHRLTRTPKNSR